MKDFTQAPSMFMDGVVEFEALGNGRTRMKEKDLVNSIERIKQSSAFVTEKARTKVLDRYKEALKLLKSNQ